MGRYHATPEVDVEGTPRSFGDEVRRRRRGAGLSQADLAEGAGISERAVSDIERGVRSSVYAATARRLADALTITGDERRRFLEAAAQPRSDSDTAVTRAVSPRYRARLPLPLTRLVGRDDDLAGIGALLRDEATRIVTIVGVGGVGKTRLAVEVALQWQATTGDSVHFVDLGDVAEAAAVMPAIAAALGLAVDESSVLSRVSGELTGQRALLLLDTFEHVIGAAPDIANLAALTPQLTVLVTSRAPLRVRGEHQWAIAPLQVEAPAAARTMLAPAVQLFLERARETSPRLVEDPDTVALAAQICRRVDGVPLAIELAAARVGSMSMRDLLRGLDDRLTPLTEGRRDSPQRHRTMRAALGWSHEMLGDSARRTLRALSVFRGGATSDAVAAVVGDRVASDSALGALVDASLVVVEHGSEAPRYRLLDLVAAYAAGLAEELGDTDALRDAHAGHFLGVAQRAEPHMRASGQREWFTRLLGDEANFRAAMVHALERGEAVTALELGGALWMFWRWAGLFADARTWLDQALRLGDERSPLRLQALWGAGWLALHQGDYERTAGVGAEMRRLAGADAVQRRNALTLVGTAELARGDDAAAVGSLTEALSLSETATDAWVQATSLLNLGTALSAAGRPEDAIPLCRRAVARYEQIGDGHFCARAQLQLAYASLRLGDIAAAAARITEALALLRELGDMWSTAEGLEAVSALRANDRSADAVMLAAAADRIRGMIGMHAHPADARVNTARLQLARSALGETEAARAWQRGHDAPLDEILTSAIELAALQGADQRR